MRGNVLNTLLQVSLQDLNWLQYLVSYSLYYVLKDKTSENSAKNGAYLNAYFDILSPGSSTNMWPPHACNQEHHNSVEIAISSCTGQQHWSTLQLYKGW